MTAWTVSRVWEVIPVGGQPLKIRTLQPTPVVGRKPSENGYQTSAMPRHLKLAPRQGLEEVAAEA